MNERKSWVGKVLYKSFPGYRGKFRGTVSKYIKNRDVYAISYDDVFIIYSMLYIFLFFLFGIDMDYQNFWEGV